MEKTTIAHLIIEKLNQEGIIIEFPDDIKGDVIKEHNWSFFNRDGPMIMSNHTELFHEVCNEVDEWIKDGTIIFNGEDGTITFQ